MFFVVDFIVHYLHLYICGFKKKALVDTRSTGCKTQQLICV
jgi:hypothetical protein